MTQHPWDSEKEYKLKEINSVDLTIYDRDTEHLNDGDDNKKDIYFVNCLFINQEKLSISEFEDCNLHFYNCAFGNRIALACSPLSIMFDKCVFLESFSLRLALYEKTTSISLSSSSIKDLYLYDGYMDSISISSCFVEKMMFQNIEVDKLSIILNRLRKICLTNVEFSMRDFDPSQIISLNSLLFFTRNLKRSINYNPAIKLGVKEKTKSFLIGEKPSYEYKMNRLNTLEFLKNSSIYKFSPLKKACIEYLKQDILYQRSSIRLLLWIFGYFLRPIRIILLSLFTIFYFAILYAGNTEKLVSNSYSSFNFLDCLYFSGITFFTIGYGEITPIGSIKLLVLFEGFLGVFISGLFIVVFAKTLLSE